MSANVPINNESEKSNMSSEVIAAGAAIFSYLMPRASINCVLEETYKAMRSAESVLHERSYCIDDYDELGMLKG